MNTDRCKESWFQKSYKVTQMSVSTFFPAEIMQWIKFMTRLVSVESLTVAHVNLTMKWLIATKTFENLSAKKKNNHQIPIYINT